MGVIRKNELKAALQFAYNSDEIDRLINYTLSKSDIDFIKATAREVLFHFPNQGFNCAAMSAMWAAIIKDHSKIPVAAICGHLKWKGNNIFYCKENIPTNSTNAIWDGHCWLEFGGLVADISIFRTLANEEKLKSLNLFMEERLGVRKGLLCMNVDELDQLYLTYTPCYSLTDVQINGLINGYFKPVGGVNLNI